MNKIRILDCTLRDGGYCNNWQFGKQNIKKIVRSLQEANIDIVECGFLSNTVEFNPDITKFTKIDQITEFLPNNKNNKLYVAMLNFGEYDVNLLPENSGVLDGIRVAFHKKDLDKALEVCSILVKKNYKVFVQPMVSMCYTDNDFLELIKKVNKLKPYAFYIVDSFGEMKRKDLTRFFYLVENNLDDDIWVGFHSHNNMQSAFSNAQKLVEIQTSRNIIIDSSVYGMGRGAGNLNTELFVEYLNENRKKEYDIKPLLGIIDEVLNSFYQKKSWGYSLPNYLSALHSAHPNYAFYLDDKKTLTVEGMNEIFLRMDESKKYEYDKEYIEKLYLSYMATGRVQENHKTDLLNLLQGKKVLLIAPGKSSYEEKEKVLEFIKKTNVVTISINFDYEYFDTDFVFISNMRRFRDFPIEKRKKCIITANILADDVYLQTKYLDLLNDIDVVRDNAGLMAIKYLIKYNVKEVYLAGFDGYSHDYQDNYVNEKMNLVTQSALVDAMNRGMQRVLNNYHKKIEIKFLTNERFLILES